MPQDITTDEKYLFASEVADLLEISSDAVWRLARQKVVRTIRGTSAKGMPCYLFNKQDVDQLIQQATEPKDGWITRDDVAQILGISPNSLNRIARHGVIETRPFFFPKKRGTQYVALFNLAQVQAMKDFSESIPNVTEAEGGYISGLIDGEGSFGITSRIRDGVRSFEASLKIVMRSDDAEIVSWVREKIGCGRLYARSRVLPAQDAIILDISDHVGISRVIRLLGRYPLRAKKRRDFEVIKRFVLERNKPDRNPELLDQMAQEIKEVRKFQPPSQETLDRIAAQNSELDKRVGKLGLTHK